MDPLPRNPCLLEIRAHVLASQVGGTLRDVPNSWLASLRAKGVSLLYLCGAYTPSPAGLQVSRAKLGYGRLTPKDESADAASAAAACSPFSVLGHSVAKDLGGDAAVRDLKARANAHGIKLLLDFIPNHTACDCAWVSSRPGWYVTAPEDRARTDPSHYFTPSTGGSSTAYGRDLYSREGWSDTAQLNWFHPEVRAAMRAVLVDLAQSGLCDGVRVQMAQLQLNEVLSRTWGRGPELLPSYGLPAQPRYPGVDTAAAPAPSAPAPTAAGSAVCKAVAPEEEEWWPATIAAAKAVYPDFLFLAEVYWDLEERLQNMGFHFTYDKVLYDRLAAGNVDGIKHALRGPLDFQRRCARFVENHVEVRAVVAFKGLDRSLACAAAALLGPGLRFLHHGQEEGRAVHHSSHRGPQRVPEPAHPRAALFYQRLGSVLALPELQHGVWLLGLASPCPVAMTAGGVDPTTAALLASPGEAVPSGSDVTTATTAAGDSSHNLLVYWYVLPPHHAASSTTGGGGGGRGASFSTSIQSSSTLNLHQESASQSSPLIQGPQHQECGSDGLARLSEARHGTAPSSASASGPGGGLQLVPPAAAPHGSPSTLTSSDSNSVVSPPPVLLGQGVSSLVPGGAAGGSSGGGGGSVVSGTSTSTGGKLAPEFRDVTVGLVKSEVVSEVTSGQQIVTTATAPPPVASPPLSSLQEPARLTAPTAASSPSPLQQSASSTTHQYVCVVINMSPLPSSGFIHAGRFDAVTEAHPDTAAASKAMASHFAPGAATTVVSTAAVGSGTTVVLGSTQPAWSGGPTSMHAALPGTLCSDADVYSCVDLLGRAPPALFLQGPCHKTPPGFPVGPLAPWDVRVYGVSWLNSLRPLP